MNGRIYDPTLGRFLQADPFIQAPNNSQSYNRYSYVLNNPLSYTDPSGYFWNPLKNAKKLLRSIAKIPILNSIVSVALNFIPGCQVWCTALYNAASTYAVTGSLKAGIKAGVISYATGSALQGVGGDSYWGQARSIQNVAANAIIGGISTELQGGKFGHGFFAAGVVSAFKPLINDIGGENSANSAVARGDGAGLEMYRVHRVVAAATIGGTVSVISGGKFTNGAVTGAFTQMFNAETRLTTQAYNTDLILKRGLMTKLGGDYISSGLNSSEKSGVSNSYFPKGSYVVAAHGNNLGMQAPGYPLGTIDMNAISSGLIGYDGKSDIFLNICDAGSSGLAAAFASHYPGVNVIAISSGLINLDYSYPRPNTGAGVMQIYRTK